MLNFTLILISYYHFNFHHCHRPICFSDSQNKVSTTAKRLPDPSSKYAEIFYSVYLIVNMIKPSGYLLKRQADKMPQNVFFKDE